MVEGRQARAHRRVLLKGCYDVKATKLVHEFRRAIPAASFIFSKKTQRREKVPVNW